MLSQIYSLVIFLLIYINGCLNCFIILYFYNYQLLLNFDIKRWIICHKLISYTSKISKKNNAFTAFHNFNYFLNFNKNWWRSEFHLRPVFMWLHTAFLIFKIVAGVERIELPPKVLETPMIPLHHTPMPKDCSLKTAH